MTNVFDDKFIKKAYKKIKYTPDNLKELAACMHPVTGPEYFISNFMYIQHPVRGKEKLVLYPFQVELLKIYTQYRKSISMIGRQSGKCVSANTTIQVFNKKTNTEYVIPIGIFHEYQYAKKNNLPLPDISQFAIDK